MNGNKHAGMPDGCVMISYGKRVWIKFKKFNVIMRCLQIES